MPRNVGPGSPPPLANSLMRGTLWTVAMRWGIRVLGILSTLVLVRLLQAGDFGLIAMAMAIVALVDQLTDFGIVWSLVRDKNAGRLQFDTAWTVRQLQMIGLAVVVLTCAPLAANFYSDERVIPVLQVIALSFVIRGFENIGIVDFQRQLEFEKDFAFRVAAKILGVAVTITLAFWLRSYWALAFGMLGQSLVNVALSYRMSPYRPTWTLAAWHQLWSFSQWILIQGIAKYIYEKGPVLFLGRLSDADSVGYYSVSEEIAAIPVSEVSMSVSRAVLPGFAKLIDEPTRLRDGYLKALGAVAIVTIPLGLGLASIAPELVQIVLGQQWLPAITIIQIFSVFAVFRALDSLSGNLLMVLGQVRKFAAITWFQATLLLVVIFPAFKLASLEGVAASRAVVSFLSLVFFFGVIVRQQVAPWRLILGSLVRPMLAGLLMAAVLLTGESLYFESSHTLKHSPGFILVAKIFIGAAVYTASALAMWVIAGRPDGLEATLFEKLAAQTSKLRRN